MPPAIPLSTYRLQLTKDFGFDDAAALVPYLKRLGISHLYSSPFLKARAGSTHGYDIVDHAQLNPEFGGEAAFLRLSDALRQADMGLILDFVPNHMGIGFADNAWWLDVLEWGQESPHAQSFDITWDLLPYRSSGGVLLPALGQPYGEVLEKGEIELKYDAAEGTFSAWYFEHRFPINPHRYGEIIRALVGEAGAHGEPAGHALIALAAAHPHPRSPSYKEAPEYKRKLAAIEGGAEVIARGLSAYDSKRESGRHLLHRLLERQHYRLASWRVAVSGINYRRFFDINDLAGIRIETSRTFRGVHTLVTRLIADDRLQGLRLDHVDGLRDPLRYTHQLNRLIGKARGKGRRGPFHVTIEKILGEGEHLPRFEGVAGTTGYERLNVISQALLDGKGLGTLEETWRTFTGETQSFAEMLDAAKRRVIDSMLASEFNVLTQLLARVAAGHYSTRDYTPDRLGTALRYYVLAFPVYRTYVTPAGISDSDRAMVERTIAAARERWAGPDPDIFDFLRDAITLDLLRDPRPYSRPRVTEFAMKLQQFTGPATAKSMEDTAFYRHHRLLALNEVGGHPDAPALDAAHFHALMRAQAADFRNGLTATATHDTKRGEDARMRILALAELAPEWAEAVPRWRELNGRLRTSPDAPSAAHEYMLYQALIGAWPGAADETLVKRMQGYAQKAAREGKQQTSWTNPNESYEKALADFVAAMLDPKRSGEFLDSFAAIAKRTALIGALNSLSQLVLKATVPGVPDFYQGAELWDLSLVDPDNRRPVDFKARAQMLDEPRPLGELAGSWQDGRIKLELTRRLLALRNALPELFEKGSYEPVEVSGPHAERVLAYRLSHGSQSVVVAVARHFAEVTGRGTTWPQGGWSGRVAWNGPPLTNALGEGGASLDLETLFRELPVAVLRT